MTVRFLRWFTLGVLLVGFGLATGAEAAKSRGVTLKLRASEASGAPVEAEVELYSKSHALVIGIDSYRQGWPRLGQAVNDAHNVAKALEGQGFEVTLKTNLGSQSLRQTFEDFFLEKGSDPDARLFVWFAGHGHTDERGEGYLIPNDGVLERDRLKFRRTALSLREFGRFVRLADAKHVFTVFDSCFAGTIFNVARAAPPPQITRITTEPVRQFLTSGDAGQTVSDDGTFAKLFIEALGGKRRADGNGDGYLTASEMGSFLDTKMSNYTNNRQTPRYGKLSSPEFDKGDFVFQLASVSGGSAALPRRERPVAAQPVITITPMDEEMMAAKRANVRAQPSVKAEKVGRLPVGSNVEVTGKASVSGNVWYRVALKGGGEGYVFGTLLVAPSARPNPEQVARRPAPAKTPTDPTKIVLPDGFTLADWALLAEDRLKAGEHTKLIVEAASHKRKYGALKLVEEVLGKAVSGLTKGIRVASKDDARSALRKLGRIKASAGERLALLRLEAKAHHLLGDYDAATESYQRWLRLASADHPARKQLAVGLYKARRGEGLGPVAGETFRDCAECPEMVVVPAGEFRMGDLAGGGDSDEKPVHRVRIPKAFAVGKFEVTQDEWVAVMGSNPSSFKGGRNPVEQVNWNDAKKFLRKLSAKTEKQYRLLSEAEWEYMARAGSTTKYPWGNAVESGNANCDGCGSQWDNSKTAPVGSFKANGFGVHDTVGNVWEWVEDCWHGSYSGAPGDGLAWTGGGECAKRVLRGGSWYSGPWFTRSALRNWFGTSIRNIYYGFRVARTLSR